MATRVCLAATFDVQQAELSARAAEQKEASNGWPQGILLLFIGMAVLTCALIGESGRLARLPGSDALAVINALLGGVAAILIVWSAARLIAQRQYAAVVLAILGTPLFTLLVAGLIFTTFSGHIPTWQLDAFGIGGGALMLMAFRELKHPRQQAARA